MRNFAEARKARKEARHRSAEMQRRAKDCSEFPAANAAGIAREEKEKEAYLARCARNEKAPDPRVVERFHARRDAYAVLHRFSVDAEPVAQRRASAAEAERAAAEERYGRAKGELKQKVKRAAAGAAGAAGAVGFMAGTFGVGAPLVAAAAGAVGISGAAAGAASTAAGTASTARAGSSVGVSLFDGSRRRAAKEAGMEVAPAAAGAVAKKIFYS